MTLARYTKDPDAVLPYSVDWTDWLADLSGETVDEAEWEIDGAPGDPDDLAIDSSGISGAVCTAIVSGGVAGVTYRLRCRITTTPTGYVDDRTLAITVDER